MFKLSLKSHLLYTLLVAVFFVGCKEHPKQYETKQTIINAKAKGCELLSELYFYL